MDNQEIENLIKEIKYFADNITSLNIIKDTKFKLEKKLHSKNKINTYKLKFAYGKMDINKISINTLHEETKQVIVRVDITNKMHTNPDGTIIEEPHIHIFKDGISKYAYPLNSDEFRNLFPIIDDRVELLKSYLEFINVFKIPEITEQITF